MRFIKIICWLAGSLVLTCCAASFKTINPQEFTYNTEHVNNCLKYDYQYDILILQGNDKYGKKEAKFGLKIIGVELTNLSKREVSFSKDIQTIFGQTEVLPVSPEVVKARIHQVVPLYLLYFTGIAIFTKCDDGDCSSTPIPIGLPIGIFNMIVANGANEKFLRELKTYNIANKTIRPGETIYGILCLNASGNQPLQFLIRGDSCGVNMNLNPVIESEVASATMDKWHFLESDLTYENYIKRMQELLKIDEGVISFRMVSKKYGNGQIRYRGYRAKHKYGINKDYYYTIGTWEFYGEDGKLVKTIHYDLRGDPVQTIEHQ